MSSFWRMGFRAFNWVAWHDDAMEGLEQDREYESGCAGLEGQELRDSVRSGLGGIGRWELVGLRSGSSRGHPIAASLSWKESWCDALRSARLNRVSWLA